MKSVSAFLAAAALIVSFSSCDSHPWSETQVLHEGMHGAHGDAHHGEAKPVDHAKPNHAEHAMPAADAKPATQGTEKKAH